MWGLSTSPFPHKVVGICVSLSTSPSLPHPGSLRRCRGHVAPTNSTTNSFPPSWLLQATPTAYLTCLMDTYTRISMQVHTHACTFWGGAMGLVLRPILWPCGDASMRGVPSGHSPLWRTLAPGSSTFEGGGGYLSHLVLASMWAGGPTSASSPPPLSPRCVGGGKVTSVFVHP